MVADIERTLVLERRSPGMVIDGMRMRGETLRVYLEEGDGSFLVCHQVDGRKATAFSLTREDLLHMRSSS